MGGLAPGGGLLLQGSADGLGGVHPEAALLHHRSGLRPDLSGLAHLLDPDPDRFLGHDHHRHPAVDPGYAARRGSAVRAWGLGGEQRRRVGPSGASARAQSLRTEGCVLGSWRRAIFRGGTVLVKESTLIRSSWSTA